MGFLSLLLSIWLQNSHLPECTWPYNPSSHHPLIIYNEMSSRSNSWNTFLLVSGWPVHFLSPSAMAAPDLMSHGWIVRSCDSQSAYKSQGACTFLLRLMRVSQSIAIYCMLTLCQVLQAQQCTNQEKNSELTELIILVLLSTHYFPGPARLHNHVCVSCVCYSLSAIICPNLLLFFSF